MSERQDYPELAEVAESRFDVAIEWLLISLLAFMPLAFGAVEAWSEQVVLTFAAAISLCFLLKLVCEKHTRLVWSWAYIPLALFALAVIFQVIPLPAGVISAISPNTAAIKKELLGDLPNARSVLSFMTLSFYPSATKHDLRLVFAVVAVFVVVLNTYHRPVQIRRLLGAIAIIGGAIALLALAQDIFGNGKIFWTISTGSGQAHSGTFVNHSHYGQFMNLSMGAALGLIMVKLHEAFTRREITPVFVSDYLSSHRAKVMWLLLAMVILGAATVFVSLARGGVISMLIAGALTTLAVSARRSLKSHGWVMAAIALGAFICVLYIGFDAVYDRLATLREMNQYKGRWQIVKDISVAWTKFPVLGTGLGTHEVVYPMFDRSTIPSLAAHAENEYAQAAEETGIIGLAALAVFGVAVWARYVRNVRTTRVPICSAAYGLGFGLLAVMIHSLSDFGQHLPSNAVLSAVSCALLLALANIGRKAKPVARIAFVPKASGALRIALLVCVAGVWVWVLLGANGARVAEGHWKRALANEHYLMAKGWQGSDQEYVDLISNAAAAVDYQPDNVKYRHWLNVYRWHSISRMSDPNTGEIIMVPKSLEFARRIVDELHQARALCPTYGATYCVLGQLEKFILQKPDGADQIEKGFRLAPCDPTACFVAGLLDADQGDADAAFSKLQRAVQLDGRLFGEVAALFVNHLDRPDLTVALAGQNAGRLSQVANILAKSGEHKALAQKARNQIVELLKQKCHEPDAPAGAFASLANIYRNQKDIDAAIEHYRLALALDYGRVAWRFNLARLLADTGSVHEAIHQARICLRLRPGFRAAEKLIADLSIHPKVLGQKVPGS